MRSGGRDWCRPSNDAILLVMRQVILRSNLAVGDVVMLSAAIRDLHLTHPGQWQTDVRTRHPDIWIGNRFVTPLPDGSPSLEAHFFTVNDLATQPRHFSEAFAGYLQQVLQVPIRTHGIHGHIELTPAEVAAPRRIREPYWVVVAGGKTDATVKLWPVERWQAVVDLLPGVRFAQVGTPAPQHPPLRGVVDLTAQTSLRDLILLIHHAEGVACGISGPMHLAAAVPRPAGRRGVRPCVVVAGGREPLHWFAYPGHQILHRVGALPCCASTGCWRDRVRKLGDQSPADLRLCRMPGVTHAACMEMIHPAEVAAAIQMYHAGGVALTAGPAS